MLDTKSASSIISEYNRYKMDNAKRNAHFQISELMAFLRGCLFFIRIFNQNGAILRFNI